METGTEDRNIRQKGGVMFFGFQAVTALAWGMMVVEVYHDGMFRKIRTAAMGLTGQMEGMQLLQLYQVELALKLEAPHISKALVTE